MKGLTSIPATSTHLSNPVCMISTGLISRQHASATASLKLTESREVGVGRRAGAAGSESEMVDMSSAENRPGNEQRIQLDDRRDRLQAYSEGSEGEKEGRGELVF